MNDKIERADRSKLSWSTAVGLSLLYASAYFLPLLRTGGLYFVPSLWDLLFPVMVAVACLTPIILVIGRLLMAERSPLWLRLVTLGALTLLGFVACMSTFAAADYSAMDLAVLLGGNAVTLDGTRWIRVVVTVIPAGVLCALMWVFRARWFAIARFLGVLGFAFTLLALIRIVHYEPVAGASPATPARTNIDSSPQGTAARRVVWVIFDELDYEQTIGDAAPDARARMPELFRLHDRAVSARQAYSPGKDTTYSIPALLAGYPVVGTRFDEAGKLLLTSRDGSERIFGQRDSIFERLPAGPASAAIVGYYHPYCKVFYDVSPCRSLPLSNAGRWFDGLIFFADAGMSVARWVPGVADRMPPPMLSLFQPMYRISRETIRDIPAFLALENKSLVFFHVNLPHPPGEYSQKTLGLSRTTDDRIAYEQNLTVVDDLVGTLIAEIERTPRRQDTLLVVSSDHWHRIDSPNKAKRIPLIAWHVGESDGQSLDQPINTVHTGEMILAFLRGDLSTQSEIGTWWRDKPFYDSWIEGNYKQ